MITENKFKLASDIEEFFPESWTAEAVLTFLEKPKQKKMGHISLPVFRLSKELKKAPPLIAKEMAEKISTKNSFLINEVVEATKIKGTKVWFKIPLKTDY